MHKFKRAHYPFSYFDTFEQAKQGCIDRAESWVSRAKWNLNNARATYGNAVGRLKKMKALKYDRP